MSKGSRLPREARQYDGERALRRTMQLTDNGSNNRHLGLTSPTFANKGHRLLYISDRDGSPNFYVMELAEFQSTQLTDARGVFAGGAWFCEATREIFYWERNLVKSVHIDSLEERIIYEPARQGGGLSVSCDGRFVAFAAKCEDIGSYGEDYKGRYTVMVVSTDGQGAHPALDTPFPVARVVFSPSESETLIFGWEGPARFVPQRIWSTDVHGVAGGPLGRQQPNEAREDEFFTSSGDRIGYHGMRFHTRNDNGSYVMESTAWTFGLIKPDGSGETQFECHGPTGQIQMNHAEDVLVSSYGGAMETKSQAVALLRPVGRGGAIFDPLFYHGCEVHKAWVCPQFRPGDGEVVFTADFAGVANIYLTSVK